MTGRYDRRLVGAVEQEITMQCLDSLGRAHAMETVFTYREDDPFAVTITFRTPEGDLPWTFSRDLLVTGLTEQTGLGDVLVRPGVDDHGQAVVMVELSSPDGHLATRTCAREVRRFLRRSLSLVPAGEESQHLRMDTIVGQLLA
ncbi:SsgA family sporulation/cell division regulator [Nocardioides campestrisoli]|uniref:SsgA family sporulation/cell division regulator n=1 Tax=Nocardioides campestrisoli TaxID=2736757 RepID=UPI0015E6C1B2|nr:SsgA family sporulation/cell division regulator [Nocardioides campestrisoli]